MSNDFWADLCADEMSFDLFDHTYKVFSQSNLCYGLDEAMKRFVVNMIYEEFKRNGGEIKPDLANYCLIKEGMRSASCMIHLVL